MGLASVANDVAGELSIGGPRLTVSAACASGLHALIRGSMLVQSGQFNRVLVVAAEASIHPLFLASFARLGVLPPPGVGCRPFDHSRAGFVMSESAAAVLLENRETAGQVTVERFASGADATHITGIDPQAAALRRVLARVLSDAPTQLLHAHGTGTRMNDAIELAALDELAPSAASAPIVYSHKGALGHSLGAAGLVSVVLNVMAHRTSDIPPNVRTTDSLKTRQLAIPPEASRRRVERSLAVAAGFGGAIAAVSLCARD
jgi:3-oxoacyl-(acyl-carrier-protein) synthase